MALKAGIVGLPNVGKSTLFNALAKANVEAANYPFATIKPNTGIVAVPDVRLDKLTSMFKPERKIAAAIEFFDIAGLVKGASRGEGLGNQFLGHIRECEAIVEVVRCFGDADIIHVEQSVDARRDMEIIDLELAMADLEAVKRRKDKVATKAKTSKDAATVFEYETLSKFEAQLQQGLPLRSLTLSEAEQTFGFLEIHMLTLKPILFVANVSESDIIAPEANKEYQAVIDYAKSQNAMAIPISCALEAQIAQLDEEEQMAFLSSYGLETSGLDRLVHASYRLLKLATFFTVGSDECRAWTFKLGMKAPQCAGIIHTDFERGFIKAEVYHYDDIIKHGSEAAIKEAGKLRLEGKEYRVQDGDVIFFKFNV